MAMHAPFAQAAVEYGAGTGIVANLTRVAQDVVRLGRDNWIAVVVIVVLLFLITRPFRTPR